MNNPALFNCPALDGMKLAKLGEMIEQAERDGNRFTQLFLEEEWVRFCEEMQVAPYDCGKCECGKQLYDDYDMCSDCLNRQESEEAYHINDYDLSIGWC